MSELHPITPWMYHFAKPWVERWFADDLTLPHETYIYPAIQERTLDQAQSKILDAHQSEAMVETHWRLGPDKTVRCLNPIVASEYYEWVD